MRAFITSLILGIAIWFGISYAQAPSPQSCEDRLDQIQFDKGGLEQQLAVERNQHRQVKKQLEAVQKQLAELKVKYEPVKKEEEKNK